MGAAPLDATARTHAAHNRAQDLFQPPFVQGHHDAVGFAAHGLGGLEQAAPGVVPAALMDEPLLDEHGTQLAVELTQDAPRLLTAPFIDLTILFPQTE